MRRIPRLLLIVLCSCWIMGCKKKESPLMVVPGEMLEYCWFPNGGYWVYQEEGTPGWTDSVYYYVTPSIDTVPDVFGEGYASQDYGIGFMFRGHRWAQVISAEAWGGDPGRPVAFLEESDEDTVDGIKDILFFWDDRDPDTLIGSPVIRVRQRLDSIIVFGKTYYDAIDLVIEPPQASHHTYEVVWVKQVGVVRRVMRDGTSWSLLRHRIF